MSIAYEQLALSALEQIGATTALAQLDQIAQRAAAEEWSYSHFLGRLLEPELAARRQRVIETNLRFAGLPTSSGLKTSTSPSSLRLIRLSLKNWPPGASFLKAAMFCCWVRPVSAKPIWPSPLGILTAELGHRLFFLSAMEMARRLGAAFKENRLPHAMKALNQPKLLIIGEVGYLGLDPAGAAMLFQIICNRYEKNAATIITSNKPFAEWAHIFAGEPVMASAALDRLLHRATIINIKGESYRLKDKRKAGLFPSLHHKPEKPPKS